MIDHEIYAVDFDGTLCENKYPEIGEPNKKLIEYLKQKQDKGVKLILWTCRVEERLYEAIDWSKKHGLIFDFINENDPSAIEAFGGDTRKIFAHRYIDDNAVFPSVYN